MTRGVVFVAVVLLMIVSLTGCGKKKLLPGEDRNREFGKDAFVVITEVDKYDPSSFVLEGSVSIIDGKAATSVPGAVFVVGVPGSVTVGGKTFTSRQIILLTSELAYTLAPRDGDNHSRQC